MSKFNLDIKKFRHLSSTEDETVLEHQEHGHTITIKHKPLDESARAQLQALAANYTNPPKDEPAKMAEGGDTGDKVTYSKAPPEGKRYDAKAMGKAGSGGDYRGPVTSVGEAIDRLNPFKKAEGGEVQQLADGGKPSLLLSDYGDQSIPTEPVSVPTPDVADIAQLFGKGITQGVVPGIGALQAGKELLQTPEVQGIVDTAKDIGSNVLKGAGVDLPSVPMENAAGQAEAAMSQPADAQLAPNTPMGQASSLAPQPKPDKYDPEAMTKHGYQQMQKGIQASATAAGALGDEQAKIHQDRANALQEMQASYKSEVDTLNQERLAHIHDIKAGFIDPDKYWDNHSKVAAGIGMILAGFNPTSSPNAAVNFLKHQMDMNLQAQAKNLGAKENLLSMNMAHFKNIHDATEMTKIMQNDMVSAQLQQAAAKAQSPAAKAAALSAAGQLEMQGAQLFQQFAAKRTLNNLQAQANANPGKIPAYIDAVAQVDPKRADDLRGRFIPGIGLANTAKDASDLKEMQGGLSDAKTGITKLLKLADKPMASFSLTDRAEAQTLQSTLVGALRLPITGPGAMNEGERELLQSIVADPTKIFSLDSSNKKRLHTLMTTLDQKFSSAARARGVNIPGPSIDHLNPQEQQFATWAMKNPNNPKAKAVLQKLGIGQ